MLVSVIGYGLLLSWRLGSQNFVSSIPAFAQASNLQLILELVVLAVTLRTAGSIVKVVIPPLIKVPEVDKILIYSIYTLGLFILAYLTLTSPISPRIATSVRALINFLTGVFITYLAVYVVNMVFKRYSTVIESKGGIKTTVTFIRRLVLSIVALIGVSVATFTSFPSLGVAIASIFLAAGFASIVIGLVAQTSLSNLIAGIVISTS